MPTSFFIGLTIVTGILLLIFLLRLLFSAVRANLLRDVARRIDTDRTIRAQGFANCYGILSKGYTQVRGNGTLVLLPEKLYFLLAAPRRELNIPLERITGLSTCRSFLGKWCLRPLLRVDYAGEHGPDAAAFVVRDPQHWISDIENAMHNTQS